MTQTPLSRFDDILFSCTVQTFESLAFMMVLPPNEAQWHHEETGGLVTTGVKFNGPFIGAITVSVSEAALPMLAGNMLGMDIVENQPDVEQQRDALKELGNVLCGNLLPLLAGSQAVFSVESPFMLPGVIPESIEGLNRCSRANINLETGVAIACLFLEDPKAVSEAMP